MRAGIAPGLCSAYQFPVAANRIWPLAAVLQQVAFLEGEQKVLRVLLGPGINAFSRFVVFAFASEEQGARHSRIDARFVSFLGGFPQILQTLLLTPSQP